MLSLPLLALSNLLPPPPSLKTLTIKTPAPSRFFESPSVKSRDDSCHPATILRPRTLESPNRRDLEPPILQSQRPPARLLMGQGTPSPIKSLPI